MMRFELINFLSNIQFSFVISLILFIIVITTLTAFTFKNGGDIVLGLKGRNKKWEAPEVIIAFWIILFPFMAIADFIFQIQASGNLWAAMNGIVFFALAGKVGLEYVRKGENE